MYKKITHEIVEEHFDHPIAANIKQMAEMLPTVTKNLLVKQWPPLPQRFQFQSAIRNQFTKLNNDIRNVIVSDVANSEDLSFNMGNLNKTVLEFTELIKSYTDTKTADAIVKNLVDFSNNFILIIDSIKKGQMYDTLKTSAITDFTNFLQQGTVNFWVTGGGNVPANTYADVYITELIKQIISRLQKNWSDDSISAEKARIIISSSGPIYETPFNGNQDMNTIFANSIINQFPGKFI
jgi:hypothetical protein